MAVEDAQPVADKGLNLPLILRDAALPGPAVKSQFNRGGGGEISGVAGEDNAVHLLLMADIIVAGDGIPCQRLYLLISYRLTRLLHHRVLFK